MNIAKFTFEDFTPEIENYISLSFNQFDILKICSYAFIKQPLPSQENFIIKNLFI